MHESHAASVEQGCGSVSSPVLQWRLPGIWEERNISPIPRRPRACLQLPQAVLGWLQTLPAFPPRYLPLNTLLASLRVRWQAELDNGNRREEQGLNYGCCWRIMERRATGGFGFQILSADLFHGGRITKVTDAFIIHYDRIRINKSFQVLTLTVIRHHNAS